MASHRPTSLGEIIRQQRERGLRAPSEHVLDGIANALKVSADTLYEQAGMTAPGDDHDTAVLDAIKADTRLTIRQRAALREVYDAFVAASPSGRASSGRRTGTRKQ